MRVGSFSLAQVTFKGGVRDRLLHGVLVAALLLLCSTPIFSSFSMRDVAGVAVSYTLSMISVIGVILAVFLGGNLIARDIQSRTIYSVATLPLSRSRYIMGKYLGLAQLLCCSLAILGLLNALGLAAIAKGYPPDRPLQWLSYAACLAFDLEKLLILCAVLVLFSAIATSTFLPMILTLAVYAVGESTEKVKFFIETVEGAKNVTPAVRGVSRIIYYLFPNLSLFDLKNQVIYALPLDPGALLLTALYGIGYITVTLALACAVFGRRDFV